MVDFRVELAALVAAYDEHESRWPQADVDALYQAVEHARAVLAQSGPAPAADEDVAGLVEAAIAAGQPVKLPSGTVIADPAWFASLITIRAADPLERQAAAAPVARLPEDAQVIEPANRTILVPVPAPIPVSERLPGPEDCLPWPDEPDETPWCWAFVKGPLGDDSWERRPVTCLTTYKPVHTHWLPAHALPLPEVE